MKNTKKVSGFTLVEVMTVLIIISVLAAILVPTCLGYIEYAHNTADLTNIHHMINAVNEAFIFSEDEGFYDNCWGYEHNPANKNMGYIYVDNDEVRVSNLAIARMLEKMGYIEDAEHPDKRRGSVNEPCYTISGNSRIRCQSTKKWCRYQLDFRREPGADHVEWGITCATHNFSSHTFGEDECDIDATNDMAERVGVHPYIKKLGSLD